MKGVSKILILFRFYTVMFLIGIGVWYSVSSEYSIGFFILGSIATWLTTFISQKLGLIKLGKIRYNSFTRILFYYLWLVKAVFLASLDVTRRVWSINGSSNSGFCRLPIQKTSQIGMVAFANSVTLTPGTISVYLDDNLLVVHTLDTSLEKSLRQDTDQIIKKVNRFIGYNSND